MPKPKLLIFASGTKSGGGSGFHELAMAVKHQKLHAEIVAVVSNHEYGGVREKADKLGIPFIYMSGPFTAEAYQKILHDTGAEFVELSGWLKLGLGLDSKTTINIHPGPLPEYGGFGMYGHYVHEKVLEDFRLGKITHSEVCMHFVTTPKSKADYDKGPCIFRLKFPLLENDTAESIGARANKIEHTWQSIITDHVVNGRISWDGVNPESLKVPEGYTYHLREGKL